MKAEGGKKHVRLLRALAACVLSYLGAEAMLRGALCEQAQVQRLKTPKRVFHHEHTCVIGVACA
jgi:hypothetical protein